jgi:hypothetical protein
MFIVLYCVPSIVLYINLRGPLRAGIMAYSSLQFQHLEHSREDGSHCKCLRSNAHLRKTSLLT